jgi:hypothetical protein
LVPEGRIRGATDFPTALHKGIFQMVFACEGIFARISVLRFSMVSYRRVRLNDLP